MATLEWNKLLCTKRERESKSGSSINPVRNELYINILHAEKGNDLIEVLDEKGVKLKEKVVVYNGMGALENWNLSGLKAGQYFVNIRHTNPVTGRLIKKGAYKILKIN